MRNQGFYLNLVRMLGFLPRKTCFYKLAFLPRSALQKDQNGVNLNNERLEYLGDAILDAIVADYLYHRFPEGDEGLMTKLRSRIVKRKNLDALATKMDIPEMIPRGMAHGQPSKHLYGNTLEALMGAIYLDRGYSRARRFFIRKIVKRHIDLVQLVQKDPDYKSRIIEWAQKNHIEVVFHSREEHTSDRKRAFFVSAILLNGEEKGTGRGGSKKEAEQQAAMKALKIIHTV